MSQKLERQLHCKSGNVPNGNTIAAQRGDGCIAAAQGKRHLISSEV
jgi:hypothetical protein